MGQSTDITSQLGDWSTYPFDAERMFKSGTVTLAATLEEDPDLQDFVTNRLGLDPSNPEHLEIAAALFGITSAYELSYDGDSAVQSTGADSVGLVNVNIADGNAYVSIDNFAKKATSRQIRLGYSMIRRMAWGIRRYAEINGAPVDGSIYLQAESDSDGALNGVQTWAKLGFDFTLGKDLQASAQEQGFTGKTSNAIMFEQNSAGRTGMSAWNDIVRQTLTEQDSIDRDGYFRVGNNSSSIQVLDMYAQSILGG